ncbi:hypothetical protein GCM10022276_23650 [Sphingomonas limnosediminicola]|uniref:Uncharacterized protein n=1 Tax=Sphingomonas limnosediminicola TaxID=940133 RepID=A0ABP7LPB3_9SPHN
MQQLAIDMLHDQPFELKKVTVGVGRDLRQIHAEGFGGHDGAPASGGRLGIHLMLPVRDFYRRGHGVVRARLVEMILPRDVSDGWLSNAGPASPTFLSRVRARWFLAEQHIKAQAEEDCYALEM